MSIFVGAIGQKIILNVAVNISAATTRQIKYQKPKGTTGTWTAVEETSTSISFTTTVDTDLDVAGLWRFQAYVITPSWTKHGNIARSKIKETL